NQDNTGSDDSSIRRLTAWLLRYMNARIDDGKAYNLFNHTSSMRTGIVRFIESLTHEDYKYHREQILQYIDDPELMERFEASVTNRRKDLRAEISSLSKQILAHIAANPQYPEKYIERSLMTLFTSWAEGSGKILTRAQQARIEGPESSRFVAAVIKQGLYDPTLDAIMLSAMNALCDLAEIEVIAANLYNLGIFGHVLRQINNFRQDNNLVLLSDTSTLLRDIIGTEATPFIYERVGMWLRHFLIDEFQDTSNLQWDILRPLVATSVAEGNDNLIIGDEKQCIYRFRNSDPTLLQTKVPDEFNGRVRQEGSAPGSNVNYRSARHVVEFNNKLFASLARQLGVAELYANVEQNIRRSDQPGYVCLTGINAGRLTADFQAEALRIMCTHMARQLSSGYNMADIAILVRSNSEADSVVKYLMTEGKLIPGLEDIQVLSDEALHIRSSSAVQLI
ncbi:MAG: UvrD-helicase domain-containing protein, partial [Muribaculaceae bacterium]|nr:UvrD-helicase domain-containing protein [Muribaculaceae bacterium]